MKTKTNYSDIRNIVEKPLKIRGTVFNKKGQQIVPRKYHLTDDQLKEIENKKNLLNETCGNVFINPYIRKGPYSASIDALRIMGINQWHSFASLRDKMKEIMEKITNKKGKIIWDIFENKEKKIIIYLIFSSVICSRIFFPAK